MEKTLKKDHKFDVKDDRILKNGENVEEICTKMHAIAE